ncbi:ALF repeat-containing protein [Pseudarthrobacter sp. NPDC058329]|uniref:ALF repeat-containing protein n=1 Tax=Pseudarthrobacter sp. NPDC058329 TaxID=3346448 RepID=UPI0036D901B6
MISALPRALRSLATAATTVIFVATLATAGLAFSPVPAYADQALDDRIRCYQLIDTGSSAVRLAAQLALDSDSPAVIREFLRYGQYVAAGHDAEAAEIEGLVEKARSARVTSGAQKAVAFEALAQAGDPGDSTATGRARVAAEAAREAANAAAGAAEAAWKTEKDARSADAMRLMAEREFGLAQAPIAKQLEDARLAAEARERLDNPAPAPDAHQIAADRERAYQYFATGTPHVRSSAEKVLAANDPLVVREFLEAGVFRTQALDNRIAAYQLLETAGPEVRIGAEVALEGSMDALGVFIASGQFRLGERDRGTAAHVAAIQARISAAAAFAAAAGTDADAASHAAAAAEAMAAGAADAAAQPATGGSSSTVEANTTDAPRDAAVAFVPPASAGGYVQPGAAAAAVLPPVALANVSGSAVPEPARATEASAGQFPGGVSSHGQSAVEPATADRASEGQPGGLDGWTILLSLGVAAVGAGAVFGVLRIRNSIR